MNIYLESEDMRDLDAYYDFNRWIADFGRCLKVKITQLELVRDRGYVLEEDEETLLKFYEDDTQDEIARLKSLIAENDSSISKEDIELVESYNRYYDTFLDYIVNRAKFTFMRDDVRPILGRFYYNERKTRRLYCEYLTPPIGNKDHGVNEVSGFLTDVARAQDGKDGDKAILTEAILITPRNIVSSVKKDQLVTTDIHLTLFREDELYYNPTKFMLYSNHYILSKSEVVQLKKDIGVSTKKIPLIQKEEPVAKYFGFRENDIIAIDRDNNFIPTPMRHSTNYIIFPKSKVLSNRLFFLY